jgi:hypothetical protein
VKNFLTKLVAMSLWALTAITAGYEVFLVRHIVRYFYLRLFDIFFFPPSITERLTATAVGNIASFFMTVIVIAIVVGGFDYHWSNAGKRKSNIILAGTFMFEISIFGLYILIN